MAIHELLSTEDMTALAYVNGSTTIQWSHDVNANFGPCCQEMLLEMLVNLKYDMGMMINPVSVTEALRVPTLQELIDITTAGARLEERIDDWKEIVDFTKLEEIRDVLIEEGKVFYHNILDGLEEAGVNIKDPLEILMVLKKMNPTKFELAFHQSVKETGAFEATYPTVMGRLTLSVKDGILDDLKKSGYGEDMLSGKKIIVASGDGHAYGLMLVTDVLKALGADIVNGGVDVDAPAALDSADEEGTSLIGISVHIGQSLDYAKQLTELAANRNKKYHIFMGGTLNAILPGDSEPSEVSGMIKDIGVMASNDFKEIVDYVRSIE
jgi:methylmalonyl-CoA mutase cobalamin-binding subunit